MRVRKVQYCPICGRKNTEEFANGYCSKHKYQLDKFGHVLDCNPRTKYDPNEFRFIGDKVEFDTYQLPSNEVKQTYTIDAEDYPRVSQHKWQTISTGYAATRDWNTKKFILLHRFIMNAKVGQEVDHINIDITDNRKCNLRYTDASLNQANRKPYNVLQLKGVEQQKSGKYSAYVRRDNKQYHSNVYDTIEEAQFARYILEQMVYPECLHQCNPITLAESKKVQIINQLTQKFVKL